MSSHFAPWSPYLPRDGGSVKRNNRRTQECHRWPADAEGGAGFWSVASLSASESAHLVIAFSAMPQRVTCSGSMLLPAHDYVVFDEAHEVLDIFASLLGTTLNASRLRAFATVARTLVGPAFAESAEDLVKCADRLATILEIQYDAQELAGLSPDAQREIDTASALTTRLVEALRSTEVSGPDEEARKIRALGCRL